jgi:hypothetical protein
MRASWLLFLATLMASTFAFGQNKQLLYDFSEIPQSLLINPATDVDFNWYTGIPALSGVSFYAGSSGVSAYDLLANDGVDINTKIREKLLRGMRINDELSGTVQMDILNFGWRGKNADYFYSAGAYIEADAIGYWFKDYATLAFDGNADTFRKFDLSHLKTRGSIVSVYHFGANKRISDELMIGARAKIYSGILDINSTKNEGFLQNTQGNNNLIRTTLEAELEMRTSGLNELRAAESEDLAGLITKRALFGGDLGVGIDVGMTYHINDQTVFTASLLDIGLMYHSSDPKNWTITGSASSEGVEIILPGALIDPDQDFYQELIDNIENLAPFDENLDSYLTFRPTKLNASWRYNFGEQVERTIDCNCGPYASGNNPPPKYVNAIGAQLYAINRPRGPQTALTAFYYRRFGNVGALKTTYTVDKFSRSNIGIGANIHAGPVNLYFMADNLLALRNVVDSQYASFQLGLNIISWDKK